ncbi:hypothetical protein Tco_1127144 [Tanacetum coccineum]
MKTYKNPCLNRANELKRAYLQALDKLVVSISPSKFGLSSKKLWCVCCVRVFKEQSWPLKLSSVQVISSPPLISCLVPWTNKLARDCQGVMWWDKVGRQGGEERGTVSWCNLAGSEEDEQ